MRRYLPTSLLPRHFLEYSSLNAITQIALESDGVVAEMNLSVNNLNKDILRRYEKYPYLIDALDNWILSPDRELLPLLNELSLIVKLLQPNKNIKKCFRGFYVSGDYQENLDLVERKFFFNRLKKFTVGDTFNYQSTNKLISFTTDISIARAFGKIVVSIVLKNYHGNFLMVTDELSYLVSLNRKIPPTTQKEIILLPPFSFQYSIEEIRK